MRYGRQRLLPEVGEVGQRRLSRGRVRVEGTGELAGAATEYLLRAGVGEVGPAVRGPEVLLRCSDRASGGARVVASSGTVEAAAATGPDAVFAGALAAVETIKLLLGLGNAASVDVDLGAFDFRTGRQP